MKTVSKFLVAATMSVSALAITGATASAAIVCSEGDCWHTHDHFEYPASAHVIVHPDDWHWHDGEHFHWHERCGKASGKA